MQSSRIYKTEAIILKRKIIGETDRILTIFSKQYGKIKVIAKGIRRTSSKRSPHLELFTHVDLVLHKGKIWDSVTEVNTIETFQGLRKHLSRISIAYYLSELVDRLLPEKQEHADVFIFLAQSFHMLNDGKYKKGREFCEQRSLMLLQMLGYIPDAHAMDFMEIQAFIENIIGRRLNTQKLLTKLS